MGTSVAPKFVFLVGFWSVFDRFFQWDIFGKRASWHENKHSDLHRQILILLALLDVENSMSVFLWLVVRCA